MNTVNAVQLFFLVWTFSAVCQYDKDGCGVSCDDVNGTVGNEVNLNCRVSHKCTECCITKYKFQYPNDSEICKDPLVNSCNHNNSFTCRYIPATAMKGKFSFFVQANQKDQNKFNVVIEEPSIINAGEFKDTGSKDTVISSVVGCSVIIILIIILITIIYKKHSFGVQKRMFLCIKHNDDKSNCQENVI